MKKKMIEAKNTPRMSKKSSDEMCIGSAHNELGKLVHTALGSDANLGTCGYGSPVFYECESGNTFAGDVPVYAGVNDAVNLPKTIEKGGYKCHKKVDQVFF